MSSLPAEPWLQLADFLWEQNLAAVTQLKDTKPKQFRKQPWS